MKDFKFDKEKFIIVRKKPSGLTFELKIRYKDENNKDQTYSKSYKEKDCGSAKDALNACKMDRDMFLVKLKNNETIIKKNNLSVHECFIKSLEISTLSSETIRKKKITFNKWINQDIKEIPMQKLNANKIQESLSVAVKKGASKGIIDDLLTIWKYTIKYALREDIIYKDLMLKVDTPIVRKPIVKKNYETNNTTLESVINALLKHTKNNDESIFNTNIIIYSLKIMWYTGLRPSECYALERKHVDFKNRKLHVVQSVGSDSRLNPIIRNTKTINGVRDIPLIDECLKIFADLFEYQDSDYLFADFKGNLMDTTKVSSKINHSCKQEGIKFNRYLLRHNLASVMIENGQDPRTVQEVMGHEESSMTLYYARSKDESKIKALNLLKINKNVGENVGDKLKS